MSDQRLAAPALHWPDPAICYRRTWGLLRPGRPPGVLECIHLLPKVEDLFFTESSRIMTRSAKACPKRR